MMEFYIPDPLKKLKITLLLSGQQDRVPTNNTEIFYWRCWLRQEKQMRVTIWQGGGITLIVTGDVTVSQTT